ncbi:hypothetical protein M3Y97_00463500 [Aphelenchoides bicaudatus]|nr:hypothetical protein M3Y97_00463500 [Aphelenchoides bicaudatus]
MTSSNSDILASKLSAGHRTRYQTFLRKTIRRTPCKFILAGNVLFVILFCYAIWSVSGYINREQESLARYKEEERILKERSDEITFQYCPYEKPSPFYTDFCIDYFGQAAFAWREHKLRTDVEVPETCLDWREQVNCHENSEYTKPNYDGGLLCDDYDKEGGILPRINAETITKWKKEGKIVFAHELVTHCPTCSRQTAGFKFKDSTNCYFKMGTKQNGWPVDHRFCKMFKDAGESCTVELNIPTPFK